MSIQNICEIPELRLAKNSKSAKEESTNAFLLIPTRSNTPENNYPVERSGDNFSDKDSTSGSLTPKHRYLSSSSSMTSVDFSDPSSFEIDVCPKRKRFSNPEERRLFVEDYKRKYKTEMCKNWELRGTCKFGDKCCFAHGRDELKAKVLTHVKYKTKPCKQYHQTGYCPYGQRCQYLHKEAIQPNVFCNPAEGRHKINNQIYDILHEVNRLCNTDVDLKTVLDKFPKRQRLGVFEKVCCAA
jgi:hypothetical protein